MKKFIESLLALLGRGPVHRAAQKAIRKRIATAEREFARTVQLRDRQIEEQVAALRRQCERDKAAMLEESVESVFQFGR